MTGIEIKELQAFILSATKEELRILLETLDDNTIRMLHALFVKKE